MEPKNKKTAWYHLPGLFEFQELYRIFLPLFRTHREYFYDWCGIGSIYGAPADCLWGGGRAGFGEGDPREVLALLQEYGISGRLTLSNSLLREEHLQDRKCNALCALFETGGAVPNGVIVHSDLLADYLRRQYPGLYLVSSTTKVLTAPVEASELSAAKLGFAYPIIVKPSSSVDYWKFPFDGMKKVYTAKSPDETAKIVRDIYASGYPDKMILQKMVPGGDDHMRVLTAFSDENGKVRAMCLGHTMVEEHTPHGLGNHAAIVTEDTTALPLVENIRRMLEDCHYTGFSNFDIKVGDDPTDFRVFEINLRQGRSNYYVTASGMNIARLVVEKWNDGGSDCVLNRNEVFWHHVPAQVAFTYTEDKALVEHARQLKAEGKEACSLLYKPDLAWNPVRYACVLEQLRRQFKKFKTYYPKQH